MKSLSFLYSHSLLCILPLCFLSNVALAVDCKGLPTWNFGDIYTVGKQVQHGATKYEAKWWTQGDDPIQSGQWDVWRNLGKCDVVVTTSASRSSAVSSARSSTVSSIKSSLASSFKSVVASSKSSVSSSRSSSSAIVAGGRVAAIPVGIENVNDSPMKATSYRSLLRFVPLIQLMSIDFISGSSCAGHIVMMRA